MSAVIYAITNAVTGRRYVGSTRNWPRRLSEHRSRLLRGAHVNAKLQASWNKHGAAAFSFEVIASVLRAEDIEAVEQLFLGEAIATGYNLAPTAGSVAGWKASPETRQRMSAAAKLRDHSLQVAAMARATRGKKRPAHVIEAMRRGRANAGPTTDATRAKMAASATARSRYGREDRERMAQMRAAGATWRAIGAAFGVDHPAVMSYVRSLGVAA